jgi:16S rRNA (guanine527-N7)-methyltransferase
MEKLYKESCQIIGLRLSEAQLGAFKIYEEELMIWNETMNLTAIRESGQIRSKHFLDSLTCMLVWGENRPVSLIDVGTGAGFPGIPLKIVMPQLKLTLVESVGKKVNFCKHIASRLNLDKVEIIKARAEELGQDLVHREKYDWAVARAVANMPVLAEYLIPLVRIGGGVIAQKGESGPAEVHKADRAIHILGGHIRQLIPIALPGVAEERYLIVIDKKAATPITFPRHVGIPAKKPLGVF